jgi:ribosome-associated translation inhibitor RaiA
MEIVVDGWRSSVADWDAVRNIPREQLPVLSEEQRQVAKKLGIPEQDYARSVLAGERNREALLAKTERLARLLEQRIDKAGVRVNRVVLRTFEDRFEVELQIDGRGVPLRIEETLVNDYFDCGSVDAEEKLGRILERALVGVTQ